MINSRCISDLTPEVAIKCKQFIDLCLIHNIDLIVTSTYRDVESQNELYAIGRTTPGKIITKAKGGQSFHNFRVAFDVVPVVNGKALWDDDKLWSKLGKLGTSIGLDWGGNWQFVDKPHFQYTSKTLVELNKELLN